MISPAKVRFAFELLQQEDELLKLRQLLMSPPRSLYVTITDQITSQPTMYMSPIIRDGFVKWIDHELSNLNTRLHSLGVSDE